MFSQACKYGIRAVLYLSENASEANKMGVKELAEALQTPKHFLAKILQQLSKHDLIASVKGPGGGFYMRDDQRKKPLLAIIDSIDGPESLQGCVLGLPVCSSENPCPLHIQAFAYREGILYQLRHQSIQEMAAKVKRENLQL
jgi:Rrf2 family protein